MQCVSKVCRNVCMLTYCAINCTLPWFLTLAHYQLSNLHTQSHVYCSFPSLSSGICSVDTIFGKGRRFHGQSIAMFRILSTRKLVVPKVDARRRSCTRSLRKRGGFFLQFVKLWAFEIWTLNLENCIWTLLRNRAVKNFSKIVP